MDSQYSFASRDLSLGSTHCAWAEGSSLTSHCWHTCTLPVWTGWGRGGETVAKEHLKRVARLQQLRCGYRERCWRSHPPPLPAALRRNQPPVTSVRWLTAYACGFTVVKRSRAMPAGSRAGRAAPACWRIRLCTGHNQHGVTARQTNVRGTVVNGTYRRQVDRWRLLETDYRTTALK